MKTAEEDKTSPLKDVYKSMPEELKRSVDDQIKDVRRYFSYISIGALFFLTTIILLVVCNPLDRPMHTWIQRAGSLITLLTGLSEIIVFTKLKKLVDTENPFGLTYLIYIKRYFESRLKLSIILTSILLSLGTITWGYGDLIYCYFAGSCPK